MENPGKNAKKATKNKNDKHLSDNTSSKNQVTRKGKGHKKGIKPEKETVKNGKRDFSTEGDLELDIPLVPESPKKKEKITINSPGLSTDLVTQIKKLDSEKVKVVLVNCERCKEVIPVPIPKNFILKSELPIVPISYIHKNSKNKDQHCITLHLDHDFDIRRQRISDVVVSPK